MASYDRISDLDGMSIKQLVDKLKSKRTEKGKKAFIEKVFDMNEKKAEKMMDAYAKSKEERQGKLDSLFEKI
jgi:cellobiose-specific phosphotransferase system component IIB